MLNLPIRPALRRHLTAGLAVAAVIAAAAPRAAHAEPPRFQADVDSNQVLVGDSFIYEVTLGVGQDQVSDYRPPDFKGLRVLSASRAPNQSTQMQFGGAGMFVEVSYSWRYQLAAQQKGNITIGPARVRVNGHELHTSPVTVAVGGASANTPPPLPAPAGNTNATPAAPPTDAPPPEAADGGSFIRLVTDKQKAYVGEAIAATWFLYMNQPHDKYDTQVEPTMEGFWTEDVTLPNRRGGMVLNEELVQGRRYQVGPAMKKVLFPLHAGRLTVTPMEAQLSRVDFFGTAMRSQHVRSAPTIIEVLPLPKEGQPTNFDAANVGTFTLARRVDRTQVAVGDAVTLTVDIGGHGNIRKVALPPSPKLDGWKTYDPRVQINVDPGNGVEGTKTAEILLLPERPGTFTIPGQTLDFFDPASGRYEQAITTPIAVTVTGTAIAATGAGGASGPTAAAGAGIENVIATEIRPIHNRTELRRELGATFLRTRGFLGVLLAPPLLFGLVVFGFGLRDRLTEDSGATRRRRSRKKVQAHFVAAEAHRRRRELAAFHIEIDRVIRETMSHRLGVPVAGLRMDEVRAHLAALGLAEADADRVVALLEECDRARFAPGSVPSDDAALGATLDRAVEAVGLLEGASRGGAA
ncbi:MAG TPA: BatD family protein [Polyangia bacterium]|jgi:hypothetical protein